MKKNINWCRSETWWWTYCGFWVLSSHTQLNLSLLSLCQQFPLNIYKRLRAPRTSKHRTNLRNVNTQDIFSTSLYQGREKKCERSQATCLETNIFPKGEIPDQVFSDVMIIFYIIFFNMILFIKLRYFKVRSPDSRTLDPKGSLIYYTNINVVLLSFVVIHLSCH